MEKETGENGGKFSVSAVFEKFIESRMVNGVENVTIRSYRSSMLSLAKYSCVDFDVTRIDELSRDDIDRMILNMRRASLRPTSIQTYTRNLKVFLNWASTEGYLVPRCRIYRAKVVLKEPYTDDEITRLLAAPAFDCPFWELRDWTISNFLMNSGCRCKTLISILIRDVDLKNRLVTFRHAKNGFPQIMPLCDEMVPILHWYLSARCGVLDDVLFCNDHYNPMSQGALRRTMIKYNRSRGVYKTSIHLFRHTFAKNFILKCGGNPFTLQYLLGHHTLEMTKRYCNLYNADIVRNFNDNCPLHTIKAKEKRKK